ncbi:hypothetical protein ABID22_000283 [Pontibacter aydingkolensis]|uniref:Uncharacterized protein n=1 Tax=Pontibacter aydingkolensis TaxID=1911536 RepID=A0ABS7CQR0_9BACT|nr:hypothetical protein [Pontibacter aydingkolensis]MBW7466051.1 hypothetical protein [Pontibacter aydingkolensis]
MPTYSTFAEAVCSMRDRGFTHTFTIQKQALYCSELNKTIEPEKLILVEQHHVKVDGLENEERDVYGFKTDENVFGLMTSTYATYDPEGFNNIFRRCRKPRNK